MKKGLIGKKIGMTQVFDEKGKMIPVTVVELGPCVVTQKKTADNDGYDAVQLGYGDLKVAKVNKPMAGHFKKADVAPKRYLREFRLEDTASVNVGDILKADVFAAGEKVDVIGTSKGKGTAGAIKRWNFSRLKESHGTAPLQDTQVRSALARIPQEFIKERSLQVISATKELQFRISTL